MIAIVDYGLGNLGSVAAAVKKVGFESIITNENDRLREADKLILPGVGAFGDAMEQLAEKNLVELLTELVVDGNKPILGICLGFQLFFEGSSEFGSYRGLGWLPGKLNKFSSDLGLRVPHMGWNRLRQTADDMLFEDVPDNALFYFVHSYRLEEADEQQVVGVCDYGEPFAAAVCCGNIRGVQFHPEKSQLHGLRLLYNFLKDD